MIPSSPAHEAQTSWLAFIEQYLQESVKDHIFAKVKLAALERLQEHGFPTKKAENYQYFPLNTLFASSLDQAHSHDFDCAILDEYILPECQGQVIVTINGLFQPHLSDSSLLLSGILVKELSAAYKKTFSSHLQQKFQQHLKEEKDPFVLMNTCMFDDGVFLYLPAQVVTTNPIQILHIVTGDQERIAQLGTNRLHIFMGQGAKARVVETFVSITKTKSVTNSFLEISMEEGSQLEWQHVDFLQPHDYLFKSRRAYLKKHAKLEGLHVSLGAKAARFDSVIALKGIEASATEESLSLLADARQSHVQLTMQHLAMHTESMQKVKSLLFDTAKIAFQGKIYVDKEGQKTNAYQKSSHLMLGKKVIAQTKPNLEIYADDVKASHGSSTARLSSQELNYMQSRGLSRLQAKTLLIQAFCAESVQKILGTTLQAKVQAYLQEHICKRQP